MMTAAKTPSPPFPKTVTNGSILVFDGYKWRVLDVQANKALILTEDIIEQRTYNTQHTDITWETCALRKYLNGEFLQNFTQEE